MKKQKLIVKKVLNVLFGNKLLKNKLPESNDVKRILIISLYFTGDLLFHTAALEVLKKIYPNALIDMWVKSRTKGIIVSNNLVNDIIIYDNIKTAGYRDKTSLDIKGKRKLLSDLKQNNYDIIFDLTGKYSTALFTLLAKPKYSIGINYNFFGFCYDKFIPLNTSTTPGHLIDKYLSIVKSGLEINDAKWDKLRGEIIVKPYIYISEKDKLFINELLMKMFDVADARYVVLHLTSGWKAKELPSKTFSEVIKYLRLKNINYLIVGDSIDQKKAIEVSNIINNPDIKPEKYFINLTFLQSAELIHRAKLFIGSDSAPLHIAGAFNTPSIGLFGPTNPGFSNPIGSNHRVIYHKLHCSASDDRQYCTRNGGFTCPYYECMDIVKSEEIISLINELYPNSRVN